MNTFGWWYRFRWKVGKIAWQSKNFQKEITAGKIRSEQFSEEEQIKFMDTAIKNHLVQ
jgi:hypothetical protein